MRLRAGTLVLDGQVLAKGSDTPNATWGAGSGGGLYVAATTLRGGGRIEATGGNSWGAVASGSGGRIAVYAAGFTNYDLQRIVAPGGRGHEAAGVGTVHIVRGRPHTHVRSHAPVGRNGLITSSIDSATFSFNKPINLPSFNSSVFIIQGPLGQVTPTTMTEVGDRTYRIIFPNQTANGGYHFTLLPALRDSEGFPLDQNANGVPGEVQDAYSFSLTLDNIAPRITQHVPSGDLAGTLTYVDFYFSETIDRSTFTTADVTITNPSGQGIPVSNIQEVGLNRFRSSFAAQQAVGSYQLRVGPDVTDLAGNRMTAAYTASLNLVAVDLQLTNVTVTGSPWWAGALVTVSWTGRNASGAQLLGNWTDGVYLSGDANWDASDVLVTTVPHAGGLAAPGSPKRAATCQGDGPRVLCWQTRPPSRSFFRNPSHAGHLLPHRTCPASPDARRGGHRRAAAERHRRAQRRPGLRRLLLSRQPRAEDAAPRPDA